MKADANYKFAPLDVHTLRLLQEHWNEVRLQLAGEAIARYDIFDGLHFNHRKFETFLNSRSLNKAWPHTPKSRARSLDKDTWEMMCGLHPELEPVYRARGDRARGHRLGAHRPGRRVERHPLRKAHSRGLDHRPRVGGTPPDAVKVVL